MRTSKHPALIAAAEQAQAALDTADRAFDEGFHAARPTTPPTRTTRGKVSPPTRPRRWPSWTCGNFATPGTHCGYSESIVVDAHFALRIPTNLPLAAVATLLCAAPPCIRPCAIGKSDPARRAAFRDELKDLHLAHCQAGRSATRRFRNEISRRSGKTPFQVPLHFNASMKEPSDSRL